MFGGIMLTDQKAKENMAVNIAARMADLNWTQKDLAAAAGETSMSVSRIVRQKQMPSAAVLFRLAEALKVSVDYLLTRHTRPKKKANVA